MRLCVAHSDEVDVADVLAELCEVLSAQLGDEKPLGAIVYGSPDYSHSEILAGLTEQWPDCPIAGCTADGEFSSALGFAGDSVVVGLFVGDDSSYSCGVGLSLGLSADPKLAVDSAVFQAVGGLKGEASFCVVFCDPFAFDLVQLSCLLSDALPLDCVVVGGASADHRMHLTADNNPMQFVGADVRSDSIVVLAFSGDIQVSSGAASGWEPVGVEQTATHSSGPVVFEIDGKKAIDALKGWYPTICDGIASPGDRPISVRDSGGGRSLRALYAVDEEAGSLVFSGSVPQGSQLSACDAMKEDILSAAAKSAADALNSYPGLVPQGALLVNCAARKWSLGTEVAREAGEIASVLEGVPHLGFYSFGEIVPQQDGSSSFQNHTCTTIVFGSI